MNIFYLDKDPRAIATALVDKHVVKMPLESAQMLSTAHRLIDGVPTEITVSVVGGKEKKKVIHLLDGEGIKVVGGKPRITDFKCYSVAHAKHPSTIWTMQNKANYDWHVLLYKAMLDEYSRRYGKTHKAGSILPFLENSPRRIAVGEFVPPTPAMPEVYKSQASMTAYRHYYIGEKWRFAKWRHGQVPSWFLDEMDRTWKSFPKEERVVLLSKMSKKKTLPMDRQVFDLAQRILHDQAVAGTLSQTV